MKQKEIYRTATFAWSPTSTLPFIATGTVAGALDESFSNESQLEIWQPDFMNRSQVYLGADEDSGPVGAVTDTSRFNRIAWGQVHKDRSRGVIAAGMENGELALWDPEKIIVQADTSDSLILRNTIHSGPVRGLDFNPIQTNLLSSGAVSGEVYVWDLNDPSKPYSPTPGNRSSKLDEITSVAWNQQVQYVLAGASSSGYSVVWDLRGKREVVALAYGGGAGTLGGSVGTGMAVGGRRGMSAIAWHPDNATRLVTASEDDTSPIIMVWDLRNARAPEKILMGHEKGVLSLSWCKLDADLLLSCGKDNRALCWNPQTSEIIGELPSEDNWAFQVEWCPCNPDLLAAAFFSGTIGVHSLQSTNAVPSSVPATPRQSGAELFDAQIPILQGTQGLSLKQPPRWLRCPVSASFGFGGKLVTVSNLPGVHGKTQSSVVHLRGVCSEESVVARVKRLRAASDEGKLENFAQNSVDRPSGAEETWKALLSLFKSNSREELIMLLGYSKEEVTVRIQEASAKLKEARVQQTGSIPALSYTADDEADNQEPRDPVVSFADPEPEPEVEATDTEKTGSEISVSDAPPADGESTTTAPSLFGDEAPIGTFTAGTGADFFTMAAAQGININDAQSMVVPHTNYGVDSSVAATIGSGPSSIASESLSVKNTTFKIHPVDESGTDRLITRALVLGDFTSAVELCLSAERYADALLLAIRGGDDLLQRTQKAYFEGQTAEHPYLRLFQSIVTNDLDDVVQNADLTEWAEIFVVLCTFASGDEFGGLAEQLGVRLEFQAGVLRDESEAGASKDDIANALELRRTATLTYLAAGRLERLVNIWVEELAEEEARRIEAVDSLESTSRYATHAHALQTFIEKVTVFRGAVKYVDDDLTARNGNIDGALKSYKLAALYDRYFEYAEMLATQGLVKEAVEYLKLTPETYMGSTLDFTPVRERLSIWSGRASRASGSNRDDTPTIGVAIKPLPIVQNVGEGAYIPPVQATYQPSAGYNGFSGSPNVHIPPQPPIKPPVTAPPMRPPVASRHQRPPNGGWNDPPETKDRRTPGSINVAKPEPITAPFQSGVATPRTPNISLMDHGRTSPLPPPPPTGTQFRQPHTPVAPPRSASTPGQPPTQPLPHGTTQYTSPSLGTVPLVNQGYVASLSSVPPRGVAPPYARATPPPGPGGQSDVPQHPGPYIPQASQVSLPPQQQPGSYAPPPQVSQGVHNAPPSQPFPSTQISQGSYAVPPPQAHTQPGYGPPPPSISQGPPLARGPPHGPPPMGSQSHGRHPGGPSAPSTSMSARGSPQRGPPPPKYPPGDRTHIPESSLPIYEVLTEQLVHLKQTVPHQQKRMVDDVERRLNSLFDALNCETLSKPVVEQLLVLTQAIAARDRELSLSIHVDLLAKASQTDDITLSMTAIKQLIMRL